MPAKLMLEGFMVRPIAHMVDVENSTVEPVPLGEQKVKLVEMSEFIAKTWPDLWKKIGEELEAQRLQSEARGLIEAEKGNRATKRAAKKAVAKRPAAGKLAAVPPVKTP